MQETSISLKSLVTSFFCFYWKIVIAPITLQFLDLLDVVTVGILLKLLGVLSIGTLGFCAVGVLLAGMSTSANGGESLLSVILLPLVIPIIMGGAKCTVSLLVTGGLEKQILAKAAYRLQFRLSGICIPTRRRCY